MTSTVLSPSTRMLIGAALPASPAGANPTTDDEAIIGLVGAYLSAASARSLTPQQGSSDLAADYVLRALAGETPTQVPEGWRRATDEALALRRRSDEAHRQLDDARKALAAAEQRGGARDVLARAIRRVLSEGVVADDLPATMRAMVQEVADLRAAADGAPSTELQRRIGEMEADFARRLKDASAKADAEVEQRARALAEQAQARAAKEVEKDTKASAGALAKLERRTAKAEAAQKTAETKAHDAFKELDRTRRELEKTQRALEEGRAALDLAGQAMGLKKPSPEDVVAAIAERFGGEQPAPRQQRAAKPKPPQPARPAAPPPPPEPPPMHEAEWLDLQPGDLALDRKAFARLNSAEGREGRDPTDEERRVLWLRVGDRVVQLRGDGLHNNRMTHADSPGFPARRFLQGTQSRRALVIADGLTGEPAQVAAAFREWLDAVGEARCLDAVLREDPPSSIERRDMLPTTATASATIASTNGDA